MSRFDNQQFDNLQNEPDGGSVPDIPAHGDGIVPYEHVDQFISAVFSFLDGNGLRGDTPSKAQIISEMNSVFPHDQNGYLVSPPALMSFCWRTHSMARGIAIMGLVSQGYVDIGCDSNGLISFWLTEKGKTEGASLDN